MLSNVDLILWDLSVTHMFCKCKHIYFFSALNLGYLRFVFVAIPEVIDGNRQVLNAVEGSRCQLSGSRFQMLGSRCQVPGARCQVPSSRCQTSICQGWDPP